MNDDLLATYLNEHLAGSVVAIELLGRLTDNAGADTTRKQEMIELHKEIEADQDLLKKLLESRSSSQSTVKKAGAWVIEKVTRAKLHLAESKDAGLGEVEAFEVLSLGIAGKKGLWEVLQHVLPESEFPGNPWADLIQNADKQRAQAERWRINAAQKAFMPAL